MPGKTPPDSCDGLIRLKRVVHDLRSPGGCPWDQEQTHVSLLPNLIEEAYETVEAIQSGDSEHMCEELGDLLLQVVLHGEIASETAAFDLDTIAHGIAEKLVRRHPHVYGSSAAADTGAVLKQWDEIKQQEKGNAPRPFLHGGISKALPSLTRAAKLQKKAARVGFDWPDHHGVMDKLREELAEVEEALADGKEAAVAEEIGDLLFSAVNLARKLKLDPEILLTAANHKFETRFGLMEQSLAAAGQPLEAASLEEMESAWQAAKTAAGPHSSPASSPFDPNIPTPSTTSHESQ
ncbi:MAG: nucleoside triphosphate pyrophosphohydrolase [Verrucomicrobiaceae bacterium]|nr:MAG: nucleoside triphosphate pyrophosphohydrolase [Verrucomicrobiaceae bacterium]